MEEIMTKEIKIMELKSEYFDGMSNVDFMYCRCCFKLFTDSSDRFYFTFDFLSSLRDLFQFQLNFDGSDCSRWICEKCHDIVTTFRKFKIETLEKQAQFSMLIAANQHKNLRKILNLTTSTVQVKQNLEGQMMIKDQMNNEMMIKDQMNNEMMIKDQMNNEMLIKDQMNNEMLIKDELLEELPETVVIDLPALKTKGSVSSKPKRRKRNSIIPPKSLMKNRPSYERNLVKRYCNQCRKSYLNIVTHRIKQHGAKFKFTCDKDKKCKFFTYDHKEYTKHRRSHDPIRSDREKRVCPYCAVVVSTLDFHIKNVHLKERNYFCDLCSYSSFHREALKLHLLGQHIEKNLSCKECGWKTSIESRLKRHIEYNHSEQIRERNVPCTVEGCDKLFENKYYLKYHIERIHMRSLDFHCEHSGCEKSFNTKSERLSHFKNAHGPRDLICETCGRGFGTLKKLNDHKAIHEERKIVCDYCSKKFNTKQNLRGHIKRNHTFIKDFKCNQCDKAYYQKGELNHHYDLVHLGIRYECQVAGCTASLSRNDAYMLHLKSHNLSSGEMEVLIQKCKEFRKQNNLK